MANSSGALLNEQYDVPEEERVQLGRKRETYEALVAQIVADFVKNYDRKKERCWIAEKDGENVGFVMLVKKTDEIAKLRMLLVDPKARGIGIGKRLVEECIRFAQQRGYKKMTLWTNDILVTAIHIYKQCGFKLVAEERHHSFGHEMVGQTWELNLAIRTTAAA